MDKAQEPWGDGCEENEQDSQGRERPSGAAMPKVDESAESEKGDTNR
jgi:hypothetical protein